LDLNRNCIKIALLEKRRGGRHALCKPSSLGHFYPDGPLARLAIVSLVLICRSPVMAQTPAVPPAPQARLMQINVGISGSPGAGLRPDDFQLLDNGKPQRIVSVSASQGAARCTPPASLPPGTSGTFTNCIDQKAGASGGLIAILIDWPRIDPSDYVRVRRGVVSMLQQVRPGDRIGVYSLSRNTFRVLHDCTSDASVLSKRASGIQRNEIEAFEDALSDPGAPSFRCVAAGCAIGGARALSFIAEHLAQFHTHKSVIWISGQFPLGVRLNQLVKRREYPLPDATFGLATYRFLRTLSDGDLAIYPLGTPGGVVRKTFLEDFSSDPLDGPHAPQLGTTETHPGADLKPMKGLSQFTGGRAYRNTGNYGGVLHDVINDAKLTYTLCYYPAGQQLDGKLHEVQVRVNRPGVKTRQEKGYFDLPQHPSDEASRSLELNEVFVNPLNVSELRLFVQVQPHSQVPGSSEVRIQVEPPDDGRRPDCPSCDRQMDVVFLERAAGKQPQVCRQVDAAESSEPSRGGVTLHRLIQCAPDTARIRVVVRDVQSGAIGSVTVPLTRGYQQR
jgi:VWFA-related protein